MQFLLRFFLYLSLISYLNCKEIKHNSHLDKVTIDEEATKLINPIEKSIQHHSDLKLNDNQMNVGLHNEEPKSTLFDTLKLQTGIMSSFRHSPLCKNYHGAVENNQEANSQDGFITSLDFSTEPIQESNLARNAEADPHFHKKIIHHNNFGQHVYHKTIEYNDHQLHNSHAFHDTNPHSVHDFSHNPPHSITPHNHHSSHILHIPPKSHSLIINKEINHHFDRGQPFHQSHFRMNQEIVNRPYLIQAPYYYHKPYYYRFNKRSADQRANDETYRAIEMMLNKESEIMKEVQRKKRALSLTQLIADPNKKLDVPKTLENIGSITKQSFENPKAPMYHIRNMIGSAKDVMLSALKVPPQDLIVPSQYKIINKSVPMYEVILKAEQVQNNTTNSTADDNQQPPVKKLRLMEKLRRRFNLKPRFSPDDAIRNRNDITDFMGTFQKVGTVLRDSIQSSQDTLKHLGDVAHSARKAFTTAKFSAPTILLPYAKAPALLTRSQFGDDEPDKVVVVAPRILQIEEDNNERNSADDDEDFVHLGDLTDALGFSPREDRKINITKLVLQHKMTPAPEVESRFKSRSNLDSSVVNNTRPHLIFTDYHRGDADEEYAIDTLTRTQEIVGSPSLKEFLLQMKEEFDLIRNDVTELKNQVNQTTPQAKEKLTLKNILLKKKEKAQDSLIPAIQSKRDTKIETFLDKLRKLKKDNTKKRGDPVSNLTDEQIQSNIRENIKEIFGEPPKTEEIVNAGLPLGPELFKPFMGQPSEEALKQFLEENHDDLELLKQIDGDETVGAINPVMFKKYFNTPLVLKNETQDGVAIINAKNATESNDKTLKMGMDEKLYKPFMGKVDYEVVYDYSDVADEDYYN